MDDNMEAMKKRLEQQAITLPPIGSRSNSYAPGLAQQIAPLPEWCEDQAGRIRRRLRGEI